MNVELAMAALEAAKANPEHFDMRSWCAGWDGFEKTAQEIVPPCGTTACYAGWASFLAAPAGSAVKGNYVIEPDGGNFHVENYATKALGITRDQASSLFFLAGIEQVERAVTYLADSPDADGETLWNLAQDPDGNDQDEADEDDWIYA